MSREVNSMKLRRMGRAKCNCHLVVAGSLGGLFIGVSSRLGQRSVNAVDLSTAS